MAKVFKIIMNIILILFIAAFCAVFIPPLLGISTTVATPGIETNMNTGSVAYGVRESLSDLKAGDDIIVSSGDSADIYEIAEVDASAGEITVNTDGSGTETIELRRTATKVVIVIPLLGYIFIATQSLQGLIILALAAALIIILNIVASVLKRQAEDDEDEEDDEDDVKENDYSYFKDLAASTSRPNRLDKLGTLTIPPITDEDIKKSQGVSPETAALDEEIEEISELILEPSEKEENGVNPEKNINLNKPENNDGPAADIPAGEDAAQTGSDKEDAAQAETAEETASQTESAEETAAYVKAGEEAADVKETPEDISDLENALEHVLSTDQVNHTEESSSADQAPEAAKIQEEASAEAEEKPEEIELAIPIRTLDELLQESYAKGEDPQIKKDSATGITFVDYSSCF